MRWARVGWATVGRAGPPHRDCRPVGPRRGGPGKGSRCRPTRWRCGSGARPAPRPLRCAPWPHGPRRPTSVPIRRRGRSAFRRTAGFAAAAATAPAILALRRAEPQPSGRRRTPRGRRGSNGASAPRSAALRRDDRRHRVNNTLRTRAKRPISNGVERRAPRRSGFPPNRPRCSMYLTPDHGHHNLALDGRGRHLFRLHGLHDALVRMGPRRFGGAAPVHCGASSSATPLLRSA